MIDDCHITYTHNGSPHSITIDGIAYNPDTLRVLLWRGVHLYHMLLMVLISGVVFGAGLVILFR